LVLSNEPQYAAWIPIAVTGVIATIALGIFGQMAKRWKDMNAPQKGFRVRGSGFMVQSSAGALPLPGASR
jgi:hypothetical protein